MTLIGFPSMPTDRLASTFFLLEPLWKSGEVTVWRSGAGLLELEESLAGSLRSGDVWSACLLGGIPSFQSKPVVTKWPGSLVVEADEYELPDARVWSESCRYVEHSGQRFVVLRPNPAVV